MDPGIVVYTPGHRCDPHLAIAAVRAGVAGVLDIGFRQNLRVRRSALRKLGQAGGRSGRWGIRCDLLASNVRSLAALDELTEAKIPVLVVAGPDLDPETAGSLLSEGRAVADRVYAEAYSAAEAMVAQEAGFDGVILVGHESGGRVGAQSTFLLLQQVHGQLHVPYWVRGGIGPHTAAAALLAGATGVVLSEQLWLAEESPLSESEKKRWSRLTGDETTCLGDDRVMYRFYAAPGCTTLSELETQLAAGCPWPENLADQAIAEDTSKADRLIPLGQEIACAGRLARSHRNVAGIIAQFRRAPEDCLREARRQGALGPESDLAKVHGVTYPILQGPMTRVSDVTPFCQKVAHSGALPFLALAMLKQGAVRRLLTEAAEKLGHLPWGVGILGFLPARLRQEQLAVIRQVRPKYAILSGGRPGQAKDLEKAGIATYLHVPSPILLSKFVEAGARKFVLEGRECGGHVGPRTSFTLWQSAVQVLLDADVADPENIQVVFAGGIHDAFSAAMVAAIGAPLVSRGMKIGLLMGTAYLFTPEAVESGAITQEFQRQAIACRQTALLASGTGYVTRAAQTPFVDEFRSRKRALILAGRPVDEIKHELELLSLGRLRIAAKAVKRAATGDGRSGSGELQSVDNGEQQRTGLYMIGDLATIRHHVRPMASLHEDVCAGGLKLLKQLADERLSHPAPIQQGSSPATAAPLAVIGLGCMFAQSPNVRRFWQNIISRFDAVGEVPQERWRAEDYYDSDRFKRDRCYSKWGSFLDDIVFDPLRYNMPPASVRSIEPIQLMALEVARQALEDADYRRPDFPRERTAVIFAAAGTHDHGMGYALRTQLQHWLPELRWLDDETRKRILEDLEGRLPEWTEDSFAGFLLNVIAGRIANRFDLTGANFTVDAACASSLAALQTAAEQLRSGACDAALVGAVDGTNNPFCFMSFAKTHALSPTGRSRAFDENADGIGLGEGIAALVVKRLSDADRDGDKIYAVVRGIGSSGDGRHRSMTAPFAEGQRTALERAYRQSGVSPATVTLIEAHGTGTIVGDQVEVEALTELFTSENAAPRACAIGSVKSMIGHTKSVAGMASLVKAVLALEHRVVPPTIHVEKPNRALRSKDCPFYVCAQPRPWFANPGTGTRRAGVSAFGFGGTNFHVVLEEYANSPSAEGRIDINPRAAEIFCWRAGRREQIVGCLSQFNEELARTEIDDLTQLAYSCYLDQEGSDGAPVGNSQARLAIVATSVEDLRTKLDLALRELAGKDELNIPTGVYYSEAACVESRHVCFLFPGQGSQRINMMRDLVLSSPWAFHLFETSDRILADFLDKPLTECVYPPSAFSDEEIQQQHEELSDTRLAQPALGLIGIFAYELISRYGVEPGFLAGHSFGECVALCAAGVHSLEDLLVLSALRGRAVHEVGRSNRGAMASVHADAEVTHRALMELNIDVQIANHNADVQTVIAGPVEAIDRAIQLLRKKRLRATKIPVTAAFHTPALEEAREVMDRHMRHFAFGRPKPTVYSNTTAKPYPTEPSHIRERLGEHLVSPVLFAELVKNIHADGGRVFVEVGPGSVLSSLVRRNLDGRDCVTLPMDIAGRDGWLQFGHTVARMAALGLPVDLAPWFEDRCLAHATLVELFHDTRARNRRRPTDWIVSTSGSRPWHDATGKDVREGEPASVETAPTILEEAASAAVEVDPIGVVEHAAAAGLEAAASQQVNPAGTAVPRSAGDAAIVEGQLSPTGAIAPPSLTSLPGGDGRPAQNTQRQAVDCARSDKSDKTVEWESMKHSDEALKATGEAGISPGDGVNGSSFLAYHQQTIDRWLELQKEHLELNRRFLAMQENIVLALLQSASGKVPRGSNPAPKFPPVPALAPKPVPPTPVVSAAQPATTAKSRTPEEVALGPTTPPSAGAESGPQIERVHGAAGGNGAPETEEFRWDLLGAISDRTGYPIDMLKEDLELEAGLGIDSIKMVEIFSLLSDRYQDYMPGANDDQEESLAAFAQMKTIRDIIDGFDKRRKTVDGRGAQVAADVVQSETGLAAAAGVVERATLKAVKASPSKDGNEKKNFLKTTSS
jgi:acyl transferase domain-containing protein/NAD(P)H-dependent flavin oxidoreductase YrpB (nitropropane dioxygenase family)